MAVRVRWKATDLLVCRRHGTASRSLFSEPPTPSGSTNSTYLLQFCAISGQIMRIMETAGDQASQVHPLGRCDGCGLETSIPEALKITRRSFRPRAVMLCPDCVLKQSRHAHQLSIVMIVVAFGIVALLSIRQGEKSAALALNLFVFLLSVYAGTPIHEFGHAIVAHALGWKVFRAVWGEGPLVKQWVWFGVPIELHRIPSGGLVVLAPRSMSGFQLKAVAIFFAGVGANLLVGALGLLLPSPQVSAAEFARAPLEHVSPGLVWFVGQAMMLASLAPYSFETHYGRTPSDSLRVLNALLHPKAAQEEFRRGRYLMHSDAARRSGDARAGLIWMKRARRCYPDDPYVLTSLAAALCDADKYDEAATIFRHQLSTMNSKVKNAHVLSGLSANNLAFALAMQNNPDLLDEACALAEQAMAAFPWMPAISGTLGLVKLRTGAIEEARKLLRKAFDGQAESPRNQALNARFLAEAEDALGNNAAASEYREIERRLNARVHS